MNMPVNQQAAQDTVDAFITGTGRLISGTPYEKQTTDWATKQPLPENKQKYFVGIAFMKNQDAITKFPIIWGLMMQAAQGHRTHRSGLQRTGTAFTLSSKTATIRRTKISLAILVTGS